MTHIQHWQRKWPITISIKDAILWHSLFFLQAGSRNPTAASTRAAWRSTLTDGITSTTCPAPSNITLCARKSYEHDLRRPHGHTEAGTLHLHCTDENCGGLMLVNISLSENPMDWGINNKFWLFIEQFDETSLLQHNLMNERKNR